MSFIGRIMKYMTTFISIVTLSVAPMYCFSQNWNISTVPLYLQASIDSNVFFVMDDSGSMDWEVLVDRHHYYYSYWDKGKIIYSPGRWTAYADSGACSGSRREYAYMFYNGDNAYDSCSYPTAEKSSSMFARDWRGRSSDFNVLYYDPYTNYQPWPNMPNADFFNARSNPYYGTYGYSKIRNLSGFVFEVWQDTLGWNEAMIDWPDPDYVTTGSNGIVDLWDNHVQYIISDSAQSYNDIKYSAVVIDQKSGCSVSDTDTVPPYKECFGATSSIKVLASTEINAFGRTLVEEQQNIANWYQYHRRRSFIAKGAVSSIVTAQPKFRYGMTMINRHDDLFVQLPVLGTDYVAHNDKMLENYFELSQKAYGTPLRKGLELAGKYFDNVLTGNDPDGETFEDPIISACQQNFSILFSDGYWNGNSPSSAIGDADKDGRKITLADVAKYYYDKDLSPLDNNVPGTLVDPATHQHLATFTVAFGVTGKLEDLNGDGWPNPFLKSNGNWGNPTSSSGDIPDKIDDMWHAAFNGHGRFVSAQKPSAVVSGLKAALTEITDRVGSSSSIAVNSTSLTTDTLLFQARFFSGQWTGEVLAFPIDSGGIVGNPLWSTNTRMAAQNHSNRQIVTFNPVQGQGIPFRWPSNYASPTSEELSTSQVTALLTGYTGPSQNSYGLALVDYLRGDKTHEINQLGAVHGFRVREKTLGDMVHSDPVFVAGPRTTYPDKWVTKYGAGTEPENAKLYSTFRLKYADRQPIVYVGGNDGMLHAIKADSTSTGGSELFAYVPNAALKDMYQLAKGSYTHRYFVDGSATAADVFYDNSWHTVLVGAMRSGGQSIFALDITDPSKLTEGNASKLVLWEFSDTDDSDLGFSFSQASVVRLANGRWAAVFGNGYNNTSADAHVSTTGNAVLYLVDIETGALIKKIDTGVGYSADPDGLGRPNGLSTPTAIDIDGDRVADVVYAGDLFGNLWKFDLDSSVVLNWNVATSASGVKAPLYVARDFAGKRQPITSRPVVARHPLNIVGQKALVMFGTGKYMETTDHAVVDQQQQTFYAIWDQGIAGYQRSDLLQQKVITESTFDGRSYRVTSDYEIDWYNGNNGAGHKGWYIDLPTSGEREVTNSILRQGRVLFSTLIPSNQSCSSGGTGWLMALDAVSGARVKENLFDFNRDNKFDVNDYIIEPVSGDKVQVSGIKPGSEQGLPSAPTGGLMSPSLNSEHIIVSKSTGDVAAEGMSTQAVGRLNWRRIK